MLRPPNRPLTASPDATDFLLRCVLRVTARAQRLVRIRAVALSIFWIVAAASAAAGLDWALRTPPAWLRWCLSAGVLAVVVVVLFRLVWPAVTLRLSPVRAARRIERLFPSLEDRLSSVVALALAQQDDASTVLQRQAAAQLGREVAGLDVRRVIDVRPTLGAAALALCAVATIGFVATGWPAAASLAAQRVAMPWSAAAWPRQHVLQLSPLPAAIHAGVPVSVAVSDQKGTLPADAAILMRSSSDPRPRPLQAQRQRSGHTWQLTGRLQASLDDSALWVRAVGGDDDSMPWHRLEVVRPPRITQHRFAVTPPSYTGLPAYEATAGEFTVPAGSDLHFRAVVDRPLQSAQLVAVAARPGQNTDGRPTAVALDVSPEGTEIRGQLQARRREGSLQLSLQWIDQQDIRGEAAAAWTIHITPDAVPRPQWIQPRVEVDVTPDAVVPLAWETVDDYGLTGTAVQLSRGQTPEAKPQQTQRLFQWTADAQSGDAPPADPVLRQRRDATLRLAEVGNLAPGHWIELRIIATDARPQQGISGAVRLNVVDAGSIQSQLVERSQQVLRRIVQARRDQTIALEKTHEAASRVGDAPEQATAAADLTRLAHRAQQQAAAHIDAGPSAALHTARQAIQLAEVNRLDDPSVDALRQAVDQLEAIRDAYLQPAADQLQQAASDADDAAAQRQSLERIADLQSAGGEALATLARSMEGHVEAGSLSEALRDAADAQQRLVGAAARVEQSGSASGERRRLANLQRQMARDNEQLAGRMQQQAAAAARRGEDPGPLRQTAEALRQRRIADRMREAASAMDQNRVAQATSQQQEIADDLRSLADGMRSSGSPTGSADLALRTARLANRQQGTAETIAAVINAQGASAAAAARDQRAVASDTRRLQDEVDDLPLFGQVVQQAAESMLAAAARLERNPTDSLALTDARTAHAQLQAVADALRAQDRPSDPAQQPPEDGASEAEAPDAAGGVPPATVLLMRSIQQRLREETEQLQAVDRPALSDDQRLEFDRRRQQVARQQQWLAGELKTLLQQAASATPPPDTAPPPGNQ